MKTVLNLRRDKLANFVGVQVSARSTLRVLFFTRKLKAYTHRLRVCFLRPVLQRLR